MAGSRPWSVTCSMKAFSATLPETHWSLIALAVLAPIAASPQPCFVTMEREQRADGRRREPIGLTLGASAR